MDETTANDVRTAMREAADQFLDTDMSGGSVHEVAYILAAGFRDLDTGTVLTRDGQPAFTDDANVENEGLAWYTSDSADAENHDQEVDLNAIGNPGGASWASVAPDGRPGHAPWTWEVYDRWLDVDEAPSATLARGGADDEDEAKAAVAAWVASARRVADMDAGLAARNLPYRDALNAAGIDDDAITAVLEEDD